MIPHTDTSRDYDAGLAVGHLLGLADTVETGYGRYFQRTATALAWRAAAKAARRPEDGVLAALDILRRYGRWLNPELHDVLRVGKLDAESKERIRLAQAAAARSSDAIAKVNAMRPLPDYSGAGPKDPAATRFAAAMFLATLGVDAALS